MTDRRSLIKSLAGAALLGATAANAQRAKSVTIGYLALLPGEDRMSFMASFMRRLNELGYVEGKSLHFEYRSADGRPELLPALAAELVGMKPDVLVTGFGTVAAKAAKAAAAGGIPVVFMAVGDPVGAGVVESLARPGGNVTGLSDLASNLQGSRLQLLREVAPSASVVGVVFNPGTPYAALAYKENSGQRPRSFEDPLTLSQRSEIAMVVARLRLPAVYGYREFAEAGGLMSYGTDHGTQWRRGAEFVDLILKGSRPADIPVEQPTRFELVVNLKTARELELPVPPTIMIRVNDTIE
jgi:putative ABC transport system substrate-binding protein